MLSIKDCSRCLTVSMLVIVCGSALAGPLSPAQGPVAGSMKTLTEIEPRTAITQANTPGDADATPCVFKITQPGSYYLTGNLDVPAGKAGIQVEANDVTIDLNGFIIQGAGSTSNGIIDSQDELNQHARLTVLNGRIAGVYSALKMDWMGLPVARDVEATSISGTAFYFNSGGRAERCVAIGAQGLGTGFHSDGPGRFERCSASGFSAGFSLSNAQVEASVSRNNGTGFYLDYSTAHNCSAVGSTAAAFELSGDAEAVGCEVSGAATAFRLTNYRNTVRGCSVSNATAYGIRAEYGSHHVVEDNTLIGTANTNQIGIRFDSFVTQSVVQRNTGIANGYGISCVGTDNTIIGNSFGKTVGSNAVYSFAAGNRFGPLVKALSGGAVSVGTASSGAAGSYALNDPNANTYY